MVMEFWTGWFDHWNEPHLTRNQMPLELAAKTASLLRQGCSINYYMFHGQHHTLPAKPTYCCASIQVELTLGS